MSDIGTQEAAKRWGVSQSIVAKWCRKNKIIEQIGEDEHEK